MFDRKATGGRPRRGHGSVVPGAGKIRTDLTIEEARASAEGVAANGVSFYVTGDGDYLAVAVRGELLEIAFIIEADGGALVCHVHGLWPKAWGSLKAVAASRVPHDEAMCLSRALLGERDGTTGEINF